MELARLGIDIGGTKIAAGVVVGGSRIIARYRIPTPRTGSGQDVMRAIVEMIDQIRADHEISSVGLGAKGVVDTANGVVLQDGDTLPGWGGTDVAGPVRAATGLPVAVGNDVRVAALGEALHGAGAGLDRVLLASIGTGVGGGMVFGGQIATGHHGTAGEIAHLLVPGEGALPCGCGRRDHLEAVAAGPAIAAEYARRTGATGIQLTEVADRLPAGDPVAGEVIRRAASILGAALAGLVTAVDLDGVIIGGGVAQIGRAFIEPATAALRAGVLPPLAGIPVLPARLGTDAAVIGAAGLAGSPGGTSGGGRQSGST